MNEEIVVKEIVGLKADVAIIKNTMATKQDIQDIMNVLDTVVTGVNKIQQDHIFALEWMKKLQEQVDRQEADIRQIKLHLKLA